MQALQKWLCVGYLPSEKLKRMDLQLVCKSAAAPNNGMHPTANSVAFMRETCFSSAVRRGG